MSKLTKSLCEEFGIPDVGSPAGMNSIETVNTKIERAEKTEEVDTVTFGLETDDGRIIKVYVKAEQAEDFEEALSKELGVEDVIEDVLNKLSKDFDIIDVEWPDSQNDDNEESEEDDDLSVDDVDMDADEEEKDGSESMNKKAWKGGKSGREKIKHLVKKESDMSYGQLFTKKLLGEMDLEEGKFAVGDRVSHAKWGEGTVFQITRGGQPNVKFDKKIAGKTFSSWFKPNDTVIKKLKENLEEGKRFVTVVKGKEKVFMAFDEKTANNMAKRWGGSPVQPFKGHNTGGAKKKVKESVSKFNNIDEVVDEFGKDKIMKWINGDENNNRLEDALYDYYLLSGDMPYGVAKARDGDPTVWITDRFTADLADEGYIDKKTNKWIAKENVNEFKYGKTEDDEAEVVKQPGGKRYRVGGLDSRFSTVYQFMIYQALLDLGIPDEALVRAPQKNAIVTSIRDMAKELQKDPVRRQALRFLINRLKETTDVKEAKEANKNDVDKDGKVSAKERKEAEEMKVGQLDDRFVTVIQKMLYQTILMLGLPDSFIVKSSYKNSIVNSIKNKAKEFQKDSVKRSALRIFTHRFEETNENLNESWGDGQYFDFIMKKQKEIKNLKGDAKMAAVAKAWSFVKSRANVHKLDFYSEFGIKLNEQQLDENVGSDTMDLIVNIINKLVPSDKTELVSKLEDTSAWTQVKRAVTTNTSVNQVVSPIRQHLVSIAKKMSVGNTTFKEQLDMVNEASPKAEASFKQLLDTIESGRREITSDMKNETNPKIKKLLGDAIEAMDKTEEFAKQGNAIKAAWYALKSNLTLRKAAKLNSLSEAKWGDESMFDDPDDQPVDKDTKVKMPKRKKDKRVGEETTWTITKNKKSGELTMENDEFTVTLDDESTEKLIKAIANKSIVILPDSDISGTKWVFSPRARTYLVKKAGSAAVTKPMILAWEDTNSIEDIYLGK